MNVWALVVAVISFDWLAMQIERARAAQPGAGALESDDKRKDLAGPNQLRGRQQALCQRPVAGSGPISNRSVPPPAIAACSIEYRSSNLPLSHTF